MLTTNYLIRTILTNMKTLKNIIQEGILSDIDSTIDKMDYDVKELNKFGNQFKITEFEPGKSTSTNRLNLRVLRNIITDNNFKLINDPKNSTRRSHWVPNPKNNEKYNLFITWLDNLDFGKFIGYNYNTKEFTTEFEAYLNEKCKTCNIFNSDKYFIQIMSYHRTDPSIWDYNRFTIGVVDGGWNRDSIYITYKYNG